MDMEKIAFKVAKRYKAFNQLTNEQTKENLWEGVRIIVDANKKIMDLVRLLDYTEDGTENDMVSKECRDMLQQIRIPVRALSDIRDRIKSVLMTKLK